MLKKKKNGQVTLGNRSIMAAGIAGIIVVAFGFGIGLISPTGGNVIFAAIFITLGMMVSFFNGIISFGLVKDGYRHFGKEQEGNRKIAHLWLGFYSMLVMGISVFLGRVLIDWYQYNSFFPFGIFWVIFTALAFCIGLGLFSYNYNQAGRLDSDIAAYNIRQREYELTKQKDAPKLDDTLPSKEEELLEAAKKQGESSS